MNHSKRPQLIHFLQLIRIWNTPTAIVDSFAGYLVVTGLSGASPLYLAGLMLISALLYCAGMASNDLLDIQRDRTLHPYRPLPSGFITYRTAGRFTMLLMALGLALAAVLGWKVLLVAFLIVICTIAYNAGLKHRGVTGALTMGGCRFLNMTLGIVAAGGAFGQLWPFPATLGMYVMAVTMLSLQEEAEINRQSFFAAVAPILVVLLPLAGFSVMRMDKYPLAWLALLPLSLLAVWILAAAYSAARNLSPKAIGSVIRVSITGIIFLDSAILFSQNRPIAGLLCALLVIPTLLLIRFTASLKPAPAQPAEG